MFTIAILGDLHVYDAASHGRTPGAALAPADAAGRGDDERYHSFTERILPDLVREVAAIRPDLLLHTGDLAQSGYEEPAGSRELALGMSLLERVDAPLLLCRGNHDGDIAYADICGRHAAPLWDGPGVRIRTLDDPRYAAPDAMARLEADLAAAPRGSHLLIAGHEPAHPLARPFFSDPAYARDLHAIAAAHPVEALLCGHTHNAAWSAHGVGRRRWLQIKGVGVGLPGAPRHPLAAVRTLCGGGASLEFFWGYLEDGAPGWQEVVLDGRWVILRWHAFGEGVRAEVRWRLWPDAPGGLQVECAQIPPQEPLLSTDWPRGARAVEAWLHLAGYGGGRDRGVRCGGREAGALPALSSFAPRLRVPLPAEAVGPENPVEIQTRPGDRLLVGALSLEARLDDGTTVRTPVDPHLYATADDWDAWEEPRLRRVPPGEAIRVTLAFGDGTTR